VREGARRPKGAARGADNAVQGAGAQGGGGEGDLVDGGGGVAAEDRVHGHDEARRAEAALRPVPVRQPLLLPPPAPPHRQHQPAAREGAAVGRPRPSARGCEGVALACTGWSSVSVLPMPSTVRMWHPSIAQSGARHALVALYTT
jgi:hypothetical protein